jgi:hypothetical protein
VINPGASKTITFTEAGSFPYHCDLHPAETATLTVQEVDTTTTSTTAPASTTTSAPEATTTTAAATATTRARTLATTGRSSGPMTGLGRGLVLSGALLLFGAQLARPLRGAHYKPRGAHFPR